jgi:hypothetical protein
MADIYRDAEHAAKERIAALERDIADKAQRLSPFVCSHLPEALRARIDLLAELPAEQDPIRRADDLSAHLAALEEALALIPKLRAELLALPGAEEVRLPRANEASVPIFGNVDMSKVRKQVTYLLTSLDPEVSVWIDGNQDYAAVCAALHPESAPLGLIQTCFRRVIERAYGRSQISGGEVERIQLTREGQAWTRLARGTPPLEAYPQGLKETLLLKPLRMRRDVTLGDKEIDRRYMFDAEEDVARALIAGRVRNGLLTAAAGAASEIRLSIEESGVATLTWKGELDAPLARAVVDVLVGLREAKIEPLLDARGLANA